MELPAYILQLLNQSQTTKILGVLDTDGNIELTPFVTIKAPEPGLILLPQNTQKETRNTLTEAMKRGQRVSILCSDELHGEGRSYLITCVVREYQSAGPLYEKFVDELRVTYAGLQGVWILEPLSFRER
ncbi:MAG: hypothetical protein ACXVJJ_02930 [Halobacteriota archaeon]